MPQTRALPKTMRAQVLTSFKTPYELRTNIPLPEPSSPHDLLIKVSAASYCHTDFVFARGLFSTSANFPHIGCHEFAGTVISHFPSPSPQSTAFEIGDRVGVPGRAFHACGTCFECRPPSDSSERDPFAIDDEGYSVHCPEALNNGLSKDGGFAEYAVVDARQIAPIPESMEAVEAAPLMCAGVTIYAALKRAKLPAGGRVGVMGAGGGLGHLGLQYAVKMGYRVLGVEAADGPLGLARNLDTGAKIVDARIENEVDVKQQLGTEDGLRYEGEMGLDAVIVLPESQQAFDYAMALLKNHGTCVVVSFPEDGFHVSAKDVVFRDISIVGSLVGSNRVLREMLEFSAEHGVKTVTKSFALESLNDLVEEYHMGRGGKLVVDMSL